MDTLCYQQQKVMILAPHADDETIGCGGLIQKYIENGSDVRIVVASFVTGTNQRFNKHFGSYQRYSGDKRYAELESAMGVLGVQDYVILYQEDEANVEYHSRLDTRAQVELTLAIEEQILDFQPTMLVIPSQTKHQDHTALHKAAVTAARPYFWHGSVLVYETDGEAQFEPNLFVTLSEEMLTRKLQAIRCYQTQLSRYPHPVSERALTAKAEFRGQNVFTPYAEAFQVLRLHA